MFFLLTQPRERHNQARFLDNVLSQHLTDSASSSEPPRWGVGPICLYGEHVPSTASLPSQRQRSSRHPMALTSPKRPPSSSNTTSMSASAGSLRPYALTGHARAAPVRLRGAYDGQPTVAGAISLGGRACDAWAADEAPLAPRIAPPTTRASPTPALQPRAFRAPPPMPAHETPHEAPAAEHARSAGQRQNARKQRALALAAMHARAAEEYIELSFEASNSPRASARLEPARPL